MSDTEKPSELRDKHEFFCREYLLDLNVTQAAIRAGYSPHTAGSQGHDLLKKPEILCRIEELKRERLAASKVTAERVIQELARIAFVDIRRVTGFGPDGVKLKQDSDLEEDHAAAISEVTQTVTENGGSLKVKMHSKEKALELLCRHLGLFKDDGMPSGVTIVNLTPQLGEKKLEANRGAEAQPVQTAMKEIEQPAGASKK